MYIRNTIDKKYIRQSLHIINERNFKREERVVEKILFLLLEGSKKRERTKEKKETTTRGTVADEERGLTMPQILVPAVECPRAHTTHN